MCRTGTTCPRRMELCTSTLSDSLKYGAPPLHEDERWHVLRGVLQVGGPAAGAAGAAACQRGLQPARSSRTLSPVRCAVPAQGLQHLHKRGVIHRDLKPANLLYSSQVCTWGGVGQGKGLQHAPQLCCSGGMGAHARTAAE